MAGRKPPRRPRILKRVLSVLVVCVPLAPLGTVQRAPWWEARLALTVRGTYEVKPPRGSFSGEFTHGARWVGIMEPDEMDILLYHTRTGEEDWQVREKAAGPEGTRLLTEKDTAQRPALHVNYVVRVGRELVFDIAVEGFIVPLGPSPDRFDLELPCSKNHGGATAGGYDDFITGGTNRIAIPVEGLEKRTLEKSFSWEWKRGRWAAAESGTVWLASSHKATAVLTLIRHN
jgi:hypothetical protein